MPFDNIATLYGKVLNHCNSVDVTEGDKIRLIEQKIWQIKDSSVNVYDLKLEPCETRQPCVQDATYTWSDDHGSVRSIPFSVAEGMTFQILN